MAEKGFGVKEINLIGASGTPTIESPNNLNLNANNVAISTNVSIGGTLSVTGGVSVGGTFTFNDVTNIDSVGIITARSVIHAGAGLTVTGITTFRSDVNFGDYLGANGAPIITFDESGDLLWFKKQTAGGSSSKIWLGGGTSYDNLQLQQTYTGGGQSEITATYSNILIATNSSEKNITIQSTNDITLANSVYPFIKCEENSSTDQSVTLYYGQTGSTPYANPKLETTNTGIDVTGAITVNGSATTAWTVGHNGASNYVISGPGGLNNATNPDLYLERGQTYQFIMNASGHGFGIQTSSGTWNSSNAYTTGITNPGAATGTITFQVPYSAPARLYYACTSLHSGMVGNIYLRGANGIETNVGGKTFSQTVTTVSGVSVTSTRLEHYEEGTFTPFISASSSAPTVSYGSERGGKYTRIGDVVFYSLGMNLSSYSGGSGNVYIGGFPYVGTGTPGWDGAHVFRDCGAIGLNSRINQLGAWMNASPVSGYPILYIQAHNNTSSFTASTVTANMIQSGRITVHGHYKVG